MDKHKRTQCKNIGTNYYESCGDISEWQCPRCRIIFECGNKPNEEMFCEGEFA